MSETVDPRAVRASVAPTGRTEGDPVVTVSPTPEPVLRPRTGLAGTAILGGVPAPPTGASSQARPTHGDQAPAGSVPETGGDGGWLVDGELAAIGLRRVDALHATLLEGAPTGAGEAPTEASASGAGLGVLSSGRVSTRVLLDEPGRRTTTGSILREVVVDGWRVEVEIESERRANLRERARRGRETAGRSGPVEVHAIIPGRIVALSVKAGDEVTAGQQLLVLEAMKMQNELRAPREGRVERIPIAVGENVEVGDLLMVIT